MANSVDPDQTAPIGAVCSGSTLFASILNWSLMLGNYLQQTTFSDAFFSWCFKDKTSVLYIVSIEQILKFYFLYCKKSKILNTSCLTKSPISLEIQVILKKVL